jgi:hypothetical protein
VAQYRDAPTVAMTAQPLRGVVGVPPPVRDVKSYANFGSMKEETFMRKFVVALGLSLLMATPLVVAAAGGGSTGENLVPAVDQLMARDMIQLAQSQLKVAGYDPGRVDGIFDQRTSDALRRYQAAKGLPVSGLLDEPTRRDLWAGYQDGSED